MENNINTYKLSQAGREYLLKISLVNTSLRMSCKSILNNSVKFTRDFTLEELKQSDKVFNLIQSPLQALELIDKTLQNQRVKVFEEADIIRLEFYFQSEENEQQIETHSTEQTITTNDYTSSYNWQNMETTNNVIDTGIDLNNYNIATEAQDITYDQNFQNIETTQYQEGINTFNTFNEYQSTPVETVENFQSYEPPTQNYEEYSTTNIQQETYDQTLYTPPVEEPTQNKLIQTEQINEYQNQIITNEQPQPNNELQALKAENESIKQQLQELNALKQQVSEAQYLKAQLSQLNSLRQQAAEIDMIKSQLTELGTLKQKLNELNKTKNQINEINNLKNEFQQINELKKKLNELNNIKNKTLEENELKEKIKYLEKIKLQQEQEIKVLRESQAQIQQIQQNVSQGLESRQLYFQEKSQQFCVKGDIIHNPQELELITRKINKSNKKLTLNLLYKATADSDKAEAFHNKCDQAQSTVVLIETDKGKRFGGFTSCKWAGECLEKKDEQAFLFSLDKMMTYDNIPGEEAIGCYPNFGPIFMGCQIRIYDNAFTKGGTTFERGLNFNTEEDYELTGGDRTFNVKEIEVYEVVPS